MMDEDTEQQPEGTISLDEIVNFVKMSRDEQIEYLINASHQAFGQPSPPEPEQGVTTFKDVEFKHVQLGGAYYPGQTFYLNRHAPKVEYVGYSREHGQVLVRPIEAVPQYMQYEYLTVSEHYMREVYRGRTR